MNIVTCEIQWQVYFLQDLKSLLRNHLFYTVRITQQDILQQIQCIMTYKTHRNRLSHCQRKIEEGSHPYVSHFHHRAIGWHLYLSPQSFKNICSKFDLINICSSAYGEFQRIWIQSSRRKLISIMLFFIPELNYHQFFYFIFYGRIRL